MSRNLNAIAIDLRRLETVAGSGDINLLRDLDLRYRRRMEEHDRYFRSLGSGPSYMTLRSAVGRIISGRMAEDVTPLFQYAHAVALLCDSLGECLASDAFSGADAQLWVEVDAIIARSLEQAGLGAEWPPLKVILERGPYIRVPRDPVWPLTCGFITATEVAKAAPAAMRCDLEAATATLAHLSWCDDATAAAAEYRGWLISARDRGLGLFLHE